MAIYHCSIKNIGRSSGKSAVAASAYRAGEKLIDKDTGLTHDYTHKAEVVYSEIILCKNAPIEYQDREKLWNAVEKVEKQSNARMAREWEVALPNELTLEQSKELVRGYAQSLAGEGMCIDANIHWKEGNHHAHIMGTTRPIKDNGEWGQKEKKAYKLDENGQKIPQIDPKTGKQKIGARGRKMWLRETVEANDWNKTEKIEEWRERWADHCNKALEKAQRQERIDHRSLKEQGVNREPTIHEGYAARQIEAHGGLSDRMEMNRQIKANNKALARALADVRQELQKVVAELNQLLSLKKQADEYKELRNKMNISEKKINNYKNEKFWRNQDLRSTNTLIHYEEQYYANRSVYLKYIKLPDYRQEKFFLAHQDELVKFANANTAIRKEVQKAGLKAMPKLESLKAQKQMLSEEIERLESQIADEEQRYEELREMERNAERVRKALYGIDDEEGWSIGQEHERLSKRRSYNLER